MYWCKYHGILTPALGWEETWEGGPAYRYCGYEVTGPGSARCTARAYDLDLFEIEKLEPMALQLIAERNL